MLWSNRIRSSASTDRALGLKMRRNIRSVSFESEGSALGLDLVKQFRQDNSALSRPTHTPNRGISRLKGLASFLPSEPESPGKTIQLMFQDQLVLDPRMKVYDSLARGDEIGSRGRDRLGFFSQFAPFRPILRRFRRARGQLQRLCCTITCCASGLYSRRADICTRRDQAGRSSFLHRSLQLSLVSQSYASLRRYGGDGVL